MVGALEYTHRTQKDEILIEKAPYRGGLWVEIHLIPLKVPYFLK